MLNFERVLWRAGVQNEFGVKSEFLDRRLSLNAAYFEISQTNVTVPNPAYQTSKGAVVNMTRALALEFAEHKIRVNAVAPTFVRTPLTAPIFANPEVLKKVMDHNPLGVLPEVDDIAAAILFLAGPAARCITGVTLPVDSGYLAR